MKYIQFHRYLWNLTQNLTQNLNKMIEYHYFHRYQRTFFQSIMRRFVIDNYFHHYMNRKLNDHVVKNSILKRMKIKNDLFFILKMFKIISKRNEQKKNQIMKMKTIFVTINLHVKLKSKYFDNNELTFWQFDSYFSFRFLDNNNSIFLSITLLFNTFYRNKIRQRKFSHKIEIKIFWSKEINVFAKFRQKSNISFFVF